MKNEFDRLCDKYSILSDAVLVGIQQQAMQDAAQLENKKVTKKKRRKKSAKESKQPGV